ncbi:MAG: acyl-CoA dehydrogenase family protein [Nitrososphaerales archaeon]|jgi:alkylation response protein AidB-like acyl-CoA dehydrogenase
MRLTGGAEMALALPLFSAEHKVLLETFYPSNHNEYSEILTSLGGFMEKEIMPLSPKFDAGQEPIGPSRRRLLENGICQIPFPPEYGGLGLPFLVYANAIELLGAADASIALSVEIHNAVAEGIFRFGSDEQKSRHLPFLTSGKNLASFSLTEPASGSDARNVRTTAKLLKDEYVINGSKTFITNAGEADLYMAFARTEKGPSCFLVEAPNPGMKFGGDMKKLGMRGSRTSEVTFEDCHVPRENLVGVEGHGIDYATQILHGARIIVAALNVGISRLAYEKALGYSKQRNAFGRPISEFQLTREKIADMKTGINAGRLLYFYASRLKELGVDYSSEAAQAKVFATEMSLRVCDTAIQVYGGYGYTTDELHRHWRDARLLTIGEGTSEVLRLLIASRELARAL